MDDPKILVFSTEKISDPAIDLAGLLKKHYPPAACVITVPCSGSIKPKWIMHAFDHGFDGVFIAADGTDCPYSETCTVATGSIVSMTHRMMEERGIDPVRLKMAAICSVCTDPYVKYVKEFSKALSEMKEVDN